MKVLHINSYFSGSNFYKNLYDYQRKWGLDIDVFVPVSTSTEDSNLDLGEYTILSKNHSKYDRYLFHIKHNKILNDVKKKYAINEYAVIHAHSLFSNGYIALRLKEQFGIPYIVAVRNTDVNTFFKYMVHLRKLGIKILNEASKVIFLSESYREIVIKRYIPKNQREAILNKTTIIPNGIDDFWIKNKKRKKDYPTKNCVNLIYVGVVNKNKNITTTLKVAEMFIKNGYKIKLTIVGKVLDKAVFKEIVRSPLVLYVPPKKKEELLELYRNNDIFVMPSITESFGLVYAEALSQGLPVIYTRGQGFDGQFKDGDVGYSVEYNSTQEIYKKIEMVISNFDTISNRCIEGVQKFSWAKIEKSYRDIYSVVYK